MQSNWQGPKGSHQYISNSFVPNGIAFKPTMHAGVDPDVVDVMRRLFGDSCRTESKVTMVKVSDTIGIVTSRVDNT